MVVEVFELEGEEGYEPMHGVMYGWALPQPPPPPVVAVPEPVVPRGTLTHSDSVSC